MNAMPRISFLMLNPSVHMSVPIHGAGDATKLELGFGRLHTP
jgi:hypothetical protein